MNPVRSGAGPVFVVDKKIEMREKHFSGVTSVKTTTRNGSRKKFWVNTTTRQWRVGFNM